MSRVPRILVVDFDNTLFHQVRYPDVSSVRLGNRLVHSFVRHKKRHGWYIILNTARHAGVLEYALEMMKSFDVPFDLVNDNHPLLNELYGETRKVTGTRMLDDMQLGLIGWLLRHFC